MGYVYVFNASIQPVRLNVAGVTSSTITGAPLPSQSPTPYRPFEIQIQRVTAPVPGIAFTDGQSNDVIVQMQGRQSSVVQVPIPGPSESTEDLWLYVTYQLLLLLSTEGKVRTQVPVDWGTATTTPPSTERS